MTASVSLRRVTVSMLPTESLRSLPPFCRLMRGISSMGTLPLGFSIVKLPCLTSDFPDLSPSLPLLLSSERLLRLSSDALLSPLPRGRTFPSCWMLLDWLDTTSLLSGVPMHSPSPLCSLWFSFSWGSVSCFSPISERLIFSSVGSCGRVLLLRSAWLEVVEPVLLIDMPASNASPSEVIKIIYEEFGSKTQ